MSPSHYGKLFLLLSVATLLGSLISRYLIKRFVNTFKIKLAGFALSITGCTALFASCRAITDSNDVTMVAISIFVPMTIHLIGHSLVVPMLLRHALEDYFKVTGSAGSIFGALYYLITAAVTYGIAILHSNTIDNYSLLFMVLLIISTILFYLTIKWQKSSVSPDFN